jgi:RND family efflux transporter MFP subunit
MTRNLPTPLPLAILPLLVLVACSSAPAEKPPEPVTKVALARARLGQVAASVTIYGQVEPGTNSERTLSSPGEAIVSSIDAPVGSAVVPGTLVVQLVPSAQSALDRARAGSDAAAADSALARAQRLRADGLMSNAEVDAARATAAAADATRASLARRAGSLRLTAPSSGVVDSVLVKPGDLVPAGAPIVRIAAGGDMRARFGVSPEMVRALGAGSVLRVQPLAGGPELGLRVSGVSRVVDPTTRLAAIFANIPAASRLVLGETLKATLQRSGGTTGVVIPYGAVQDDGGQPFVFVVQNGVAHKRKVELGAQAGNDVLVVRGVAAGDQVVTTGGTALDDGMKVRTGAYKPDETSGKFDKSNADKGKADKE